MRYCLLMHYQEGSSIGLTEEDMAPAMAAFAAYADDLSAAGVLITTEVLDTVASTTTVTARNGTPRSRTGRSPTPRRNWAASSSSTCRTSTRRSPGRSATPRTVGVRSKYARWQGHTPPIADGTAPDCGPVAGGPTIGRGHPRVPWPAACPARGARARHRRGRGRPRATRWSAPCALADGRRARQPGSLAARRRPQPAPRLVEVGRAPDQRPARRNGSRDQSNSTTPPPTFPTAGSR